MQQRKKHDEMFNNDEIEMKEEKVMVDNLYPSLDLSNPSKKKFAKNLTAVINQELKKQSVHSKIQLTENNIHITYTYIPSVNDRSLQLILIHLTFEQRDLIIRTLYNQNVNKFKDSKENLWHFSVSSISPLILEHKDQSELCYMNLGGKASYFIFRKIRYHIFLGTMSQEAKKSESFSMDSLDDNQCKTELMALRSEAECEFSKTQKLIPLQKQYHREKNQKNILNEIRYMFFALKIYTENRKVFNDKKIKTQTQKKKSDQLDDMLKEIGKTRDNLQTLLTDIYATYADTIKADKISINNGKDLEVNDYLGLFNAKLLNMFVDPSKKKEEEKGDDIEQKDDIAPDMVNTVDDDVPALQLAKKEHDFLINTLVNNLIGLVNKYMQSEAIEKRSTDRTFQKDLKTWEQGEMKNHMRTYPDPSKYFFSNSEINGYKKEYQGKAGKEFKFNPEKEKDPKTKQILGYKVEKYFEDNKESYNVYTK